MLISDTREIAAIPASLTPWLGQHMPEADEVSIRALDMPAEGGSSATYFITVDLQQSGVAHRREFVLRVQATDYQIYQDPAVKKQFEVMRALGELGDVPVPRVFWYEPDASILGAPFFLMEKVGGQIPPPFHHAEGYLVELSAAERRSLWSEAVTTMARIHSAPVEAFGFLDDTATTGDVLAAELRRWVDYMRWSGIEIRSVQQSAKRWLEENLPARGEAGLAWGDARPGNLIFEGTRCIAVLDWETASLAGAESDIAWWLLYDWMTTVGLHRDPLPGWGGREETIQCWSEAAGRPLRHMTWHDVFAAWRYSLISDRARSLLRQRDPTHPVANDRPSPAVDRLEQLLAADSQRGGHND